MQFFELQHDHEERSQIATDRAAAASKSTWISVVVNIFLAVEQIAAGIFAKSQGLIADGIHSLSDLVADFVVLFANHNSKKDADKDHPNGHQRFETAASLVLGVLFLVVGFGMLISAIKKLQTPSEIPQVQIVALWVACAALIAKELLFRYMLAVAKRVKSNMLIANAWDARSDAASSQVVAVGIIGNLAGYPSLDHLAALIVGFMVTRMGWEFGWDAMNDLMDRGADDSEVEAIRQTLLETPGLDGVHDLKTRKMGDMLLVDAHIEVHARQTVEDGHGIAVEARKRVLERRRVINLMTHVDPGYRREAASE